MVRPVFHIRARERRLRHPGRVATGNRSDDINGTADSDLSTARVFAARLGGTKLNDPAVDR